MVDEQKDLAEARALMVKKQLAERYIGDSRVLAAMQEIPRHRFLMKTARSPLAMTKPYHSPSLWPL
jgi:protein-L-isoaspartate O-methyltransferase